MCRRQYYYNDCDVEGCGTVFTGPDLAERLTHYKLTAGHVYCKPCKITFKDDVEALCRHRRLDNVAHLKQCPIGCEMESHASDYDDGSGPRWGPLKTHIKRVGVLLQ